MTPGAAQPPRESDALDARTPRRRPLAIGVSAAVFLLAGAAYVGGYAMAGDTVPRNATISGVDVGGMDAEEATEVLQSEFEDRLSQPVSLHVEDEAFEVVPAEAGVSIDYQASLAKAGVGRSWSPGHIWRVLSGGGATSAALTFDEEAMAQASEDVASAVQREATNAAVAVSDDAEVEVSPGLTTRTLASGGLEAALREAVPAERQANLPVEETEPDITTAEAEKFAESFARPAVAAPVTVNIAEGGSFDITGEMIAQSLVIEHQESTISGTVEADDLMEQIRPLIREESGYEAAEDASWELSGGKPKLVPSTTGVGPDKEELVDKVTEVLPKEGEDRAVSVEFTEQEADFTTEDAQEAAPTEVIGQFTTEFPHADYRNTNLGQVANRINGYVLLPGETFSMNEVVGQRTEENGFASGWVIQGGREVQEVGGGVSQGATTIFNAAFLAGLEDVEHHPHTLYYDRYPAGREATVYYGSLDLQFRNNTDSVVIIQASRNSSSPGENGSLTVKMWGDSPWDEIRAPEPETSNFTYGRTITDSGPDCTPQAPGQGLTASYYRAFIKDGVEQKRDSYTWTYDPRDEIRCS